MDGCSRKTRSRLRFRIAAAHTELIAITAAKAYTEDESSLAYSFFSLPESVGSILTPAAVRKRIEARMNPQRNYRIRISELLSADEIRKAAKKTSDDTYFVQITPDENGPFAEFHGDPQDSDKIAKALELIASAK
jgi:hypothetical protein